MRGIEGLQSATYIRSRKHGDENAVVEEFVAVLDDHMCPTHQIKVMLL